MATVGQQLLAPEAGWKRYDDRDSRLLYRGVFSTASDTGMYLNTQHYSTNIGDSIMLKFYGTKIRLINTIHSNRGVGSIISIKIDNGADETFSGYKVSGYQFQTIVYEKLNLTPGIHTITITNVSSVYLDCDAIDIDDTGYLVHPTLNQVNNINTMVVGDVIPCRYTATTSGTAGYFSELGTCITNEIPITGTATPDGLFYLIKTDKGTLIADRTIQTNISWDVLNAAKFIEGAKDPYTSLLIHFDNIIKDECGHVIINNNVILDSINKYYGESSGLFDGVSSFLSLPNYTDFNFLHQVGTTGKWTIDSRLKLPTTLTHGNYLIDTCSAASINSGITIYIGSDFSITVAIDRSVTGWFVILYQSVANLFPKDGMFHHLEISYDQSLASNNLKIFIDGILVITQTKTANAPSTLDCKGFSIGKPFNDTGNTFMGNIDEFRISKGIIRHTSNFIPATGPSFYELIRSMSGGCAYVDASGNSSLTDKSLGAWPTNNEWDKYIVNSDLKGKIAKGDDNIWHWGGTISSWAKETAINGLYSLGSSTGDGTNTSRVVRGKSDAYGGLKRFNIGVSSLVIATAGFRPVLNYVESDIASEVIN